MVSVYVQEPTYSIKLLKGKNNFRELKKKKTQKEGKKEKNEKKTFTQ